MLWRRNRSRASFTETEPIQQARIGLRDFLRNSHSFSATAVGFVCACGVRITSTASMPLSSRQALTAAW